KCELLTVESPELESGKFDRATAETNVVIDWVDDNGTNHATAAKAVYTHVITNLAKLPEEQWQTNSFVVLTGNPFVVSPRGTFTGDPIIWDRIHDVIKSSGSIDMKVNPDKNQTNSPAPGFLDMPNSKPAPK